VTAGVRLVALVAFPALPNFDKETLMLAALWAMIVAGAVVALGAVVLFRRERALRRSLAGDDRAAASGARPERP
jgi:hypothetical protein